MYAIYDCTQKAFSVAPTLLSDYFKAHIDVTCCYNPKNNTVFLTWADDYDSEYNPYFAIYDCTNNQIVVNPTQIDKHKYTRGVKYDVFATPVEKENLIFLSWSEKKADGEPIYAVYDWLNDKFIVDPTGIESEIFEFPQLDVSPCYDPIKNTVLLSWSGNFGNFYAIYDCREKKFSQTSSLIPNTQNDQHLSRVNVISVFLEKNPSIFISWATKYTISFTTYYDSKTALKYLFKKSPVDFQKGN